MTNTYTILIVDDEIDLLEMFQDYFEMEGSKVYPALSAAIGLELLDQHDDIQVIISDFHMPGISGLEFLKRVSAHPNKMPLFYLATGDIDQSDSEIIKLGGTGIISKPFDLDLVTKKILKDLNGSK